jgi:hypothetical protein
MEGKVALSVVAKVPVAAGDDGAAAPLTSTVALLLLTVEDVVLTAGVDVLLTNRVEVSLTKEPEVLVI